MNWIIKCLAFQTLSRFPGGRSFHHAAQNWLTGSSRQTESRLLGKIGQTLNYWRWLEANAPAGWLADASHLDLGSGWVPSVPMTLYALGTRRQYLVDIEAHMQPAAVVQTAELFRRVAPKAGVTFQRIPDVPARQQTLRATLEPFGMNYSAPYDELTEQIAGTVGFATATHMLLHLNRPVLLAVCRTVYRMLKPGGYFLAQQHLRQLFDGLESRTSPFYSLRYSDRFWENYVNSPMMSYNRLRARDYRQTLQEAGFEVECFEVEPGSPQDFAQLKRARIHPMFSGYTPDELAARHLFFAARKPCPTR
ncbi:MAG: Methyltransferase type 11 [Pedosphaera sp.]|nr:Methyltransferase type 11 [Pedosphaera sp.]